MGNVLVPASVLMTVGAPYYDSTGQLQGWEGSPLFVVEFVDREQSDFADSWERLALAVFKAAWRFQHIGERGNVVAYDDIGLTDEYTPNWVSDPYLSVRGVSVTADTKGMLSRDMGEAMLRALVEKLRQLPFDTRVSGGDTGSDHVSWRPPHAEPLEGRNRDAKPRTHASEPRAKPRFWVIKRGVRCVVQNGVPGVMVEYLDAEDGWTTSLPDARRFELNERGNASNPSLFAWRLMLSMLEEA